MQNKIIRVIYKIPATCFKAELYEQANLGTINDLYLYEMFKLCVKSYCNDMPTPFLNNIINWDYEHNYNTRRAAQGLLRSEIQSTTHLKHSVKNRATSLANILIMHSILDPNIISYSQNAKNDYIHNFRDDFCCNNKSYIDFVLA